MMRSFLPLILSTSARIFSVRLARRLRLDFRRFIFGRAPSLRRGPAGSLAEFCESADEVATEVPRCRELTRYAKRAACYTRTTVAGPARSAAARRRDLVAGLEAGRAVLRTYATEVR